MTTSVWLRALHNRLDDRSRAGLARTVQPRDSALIDLGTNDYLGLSSHPRVIEAVAKAARTFGVGSGASRLVGGTTELHHRVESRFAAFKGAERALILPTGYMANLALLGSLPSPDDLVLLDRLNHASLLDAAAHGSDLVSRIKFRRYAHRDVAHARVLANRHLGRHPGATVWIVTDSVFSMDGNIAPIAELSALRDELNDGGSACLILDEAHATGLLGESGAGANEAAGHIADICVSTASKALGSLGGVITGPAAAIDAIVNFARPFIFTTAVPPTQLAAIDAALDVIQDEPKRRKHVRTHAQRFRASLIDKGWPADTLGDDPTPIIPLIVGEPSAAVELSRHLETEGFYAPAIRPPSVPKGTSRVRVSVHARLSDEQLERLIEAIPEGG